MELYEPYKSFWVEHRYEFVLKKEKQSLDPPSCQN